jgi:peptidoglycan/LPS O-acetylase OafA/YrhL
LANKVHAISGIINTFANIMTPRYITNLTALRGIAALITVLYHVDVWIGNGGGMLIPREVSRMPDRLYLMVDFFFVLSGFIMYHVYGHAFASGVGKSDFWSFLRARFARVYPLHVLSLFLMMGLLYGAHKVGVPYLPALEVENHTYSVLTNLFLLHSMNFHGWFSWVHASWSISTEWWMYMLFPLLVAPFERIGSVARWGVFVACYGLYVAIMLYIAPSVAMHPSAPMPQITSADMTINIAFKYGFVRCFAGFLIGMVVYKAYRENWGQKWLANGYAMLALTVALFVAMHLLAPDALTVATFPWLILGAAYGSESVNRILQSRPLQRLGDWSFSIYLMHQPLLVLFFTVLTILQPPTPETAGVKPDLVTAWVMSGIIVALTLAVSALVYRFWEKPARRWINAFGKD